MHRLIGLITVIWVASFGAAISQSANTADEHPVIVELYTSQGCSSCPPADALLLELAARRDVIALALHVDYWDYIGWKDIFAKPAFTDRQHAYAKAAQRRSVYTPQMIISGQDQVVGNRPREVSDLIAHHTKQMGDVALKVARTGNTITIDLAALTKVQGEMTVQLVRYIPRENVAIKRGENAGRDLSYANIVTEWRVLRDWNPAKSARFQTRVKGDLPVVVIVQRKGFGAILAAARLQ